MEKIRMAKDDTHRNSILFRGSNSGSRDGAVKVMHLSAPLCFLTFVKRVPKHLFKNYIHIRTSIEM